MTKLYYDIDIFDRDGCLDHNATVATIDEAYLVAGGRRLEITSVSTDGDKYNSPENKIAIFVAIGNE